MKKGAVHVAALSVLVFWPVVASANQNPFAALKGRDRLPPTHYKITSIGRLPGNTISYANANNSREVVGASDNQAVAYLNGVLRPIGAIVGISNGNPGVISSSANAINNSGYIVGVAQSFSGVFSEVCTVETAAINFSGPPIGYVPNSGCPEEGTAATGVNNLGGVVGDIETVVPLVTGVFYSYHGVATLLDPGYNQQEDVSGLGGSVSGINDNGIAVGSSGTAEIYTLNGNWTIGTLGGPYSNAEAIADSNIIVGSSSLSKLSDVQHAFVYYDKIMYDFGTPIGTNPITTSSNATSINNFNEFVGTYTLANGTQRAFVYAEYVMHDLKSLVENNAGWTLLTATGTNDCGDIVGAGIYNGNTVGYLARAINVNNQPKRRNFGCTF